MYLQFAKSFNSCTHGINAFCNTFWQSFDKQKYKGIRKIHPVQQFMILGTVSAICKIFVIHVLCTHGINAFCNTFLQSFIKQNAL
jgi:hypothetical protein